MQKYGEGELSKSQMILEQGTNAYSAFGGVYGAAWGVGWEIGRGISKIPTYQKWKQKTWFPWRKANLGY